MWPRSESSQQHVWHQAPVRLRKVTSTQPASDQEGRDDRESGLKGNTYLQAHTYARIQEGCKLTKDMQGEHACTRTYCTAVFTVRLRGRSHRHGETLNRSCKLQQSQRHSCCAP